MASEPRSEDKHASLIIDCRRVDCVLLSGVTPPDAVDLELPTRIGQPDRRVRVGLDQVELAP